MATAHLIDSLACKDAPSDYDNRRDGKMNEPSKVLLGSAYKMEPGYDECARYLLRPLCGGIGVLSGMAEFYDYHAEGSPSLQNAFCESPSSAAYGPFLGDFLAMMDYVDEDVRFFCMTDRSRMREYINSYLEDLLRGVYVDEIWQMIGAHLARHTCSESGYRQNIVVGTPYFNDLFYSTSWKAAQALFSPDAISSLQSLFKFIRGYNPVVPAHKAFVFYFDGGQNLRFFFDARDGQCRMDDTLFMVSKDFHCSENEYKQSFEKYVLFLSNWSLILACWMSMHEFGQCAFGLYWETGVMALCQRMRREEWWRTHRR